MELSVNLGETEVGHIRTQRDGRTEFAFSSTYLGLDVRPVLGQYFEDHLTEIHRSQTHLPAFFSNLLPEGGLRELIARRAGIRGEREAQLIAVLGADLPGAVIVRQVSGEGDEEAPTERSEMSPEAPEPLRFSLAGAQLKFSVLYRVATRGPTLPVDGRGGDWIAKLPSESYANVPENEYAMVRWAGQVGINVPEVDLVRVKDIEGLPVRLEPDRAVFLSRRFDRLPNGGRQHQEDFAQVANVRRSERYGVLGHSSIARIVRSIAGEDDFDEVIRRTAFNVLIGNGDAHLKNWSLTYPDGVQARLSPAYDLVATITYIPTDKLALKLSRENRFERITLTHFEKLAMKVGVPPARVVATVRETVQRAMACWPVDVDKERDQLLRDHVRRLPLLKEAG